MVALFYSIEDLVISLMKEMAKVYNVILSLEMFFGWNSFLYIPIVQDTKFYGRSQPGPRARIHSCTVGVVSQKGIAIIKL